MVRRIYGIYDKKALVYLNGVLMTFGTDSEATRVFAQVIAAGKSPLSEYPEDFELHYLGDIDLDEVRIDPALGVRENPVTTGFATVRELKRLDAARRTEEGPHSAR